MKVALDGQPVIDFTVPNDVSQVHIDPSSGLRSYAGGPAVLEYFVAGSEPSDTASAPVAETIEEIGTPAGVVPTAPTGDD
jgi:membrane carboxypeptidase/penicillin-binding protein